MSADDVLRAAAEKSGVNAHRLAAATELPYTSINKWLRGERPKGLYLYEAVAIADALQVSPRELLGGESRHASSARRWQSRAEELAAELESVSDKVSRARALLDGAPY